MLSAAVARLRQTGTDVDALGDVLSGTEGLDLWDYGRAIAILIGSVVFGRLVRFAIKRVVSRTRTDDFLGDLIGRIVFYLVIAFGLVYALETLGIAVAPILGALGIVGIALAFALQDILENFVAGIILQMRRPFTKGDEIVTDEHEGTVVEIDARTVTINNPDGEMIRLPSASVIKNPIINHTQNGRRRTTVNVGVAYGTDLDLARRVAGDAARSVDRVLSQPDVQTYVYEFGDSSINLAVRFWHEPSIASMWMARDQVARAIDRGFAEHGIEIPFPQRVLHGGLRLDGRSTPDMDDPDESHQS